MSPLSGWKVLLLDDAPWDDVIVMWYISPSTSTCPIKAMDMEDTNIARQMFRVFDMDPWYKHTVHGSEIPRPTTWDGAKTL